MHQKFKIGFEKIAGVSDKTLTNIIAKRALKSKGFDMSLAHKDRVLGAIKSNTKFHGDQSNLNWAKKTPDKDRSHRDAISAAQKLFPKKK